MSDEKQNNELRYQLWGWVLFMICAILFTISSARAGDILSTAASLVFLGGCVVFMIPLVKAITQISKE